MAVQHGLEMSPQRRQREEIGAHDCGHDLEHGPETVVDPLRNGFHLLDFGVELDDGNEADNCRGKTEE